MYLYLDLNCNTLRVIIVLCAALYAVLGNCSRFFEFHDSCDDKFFIKCNIDELRNFIKFSDSGPCNWSATGAYSRMTRSSRAQTAPSTSRPPTPTAARYSVSWFIFRLCSGKKVKFLFLIFEYKNLCYISGLKMSTFEVKSWTQFFNDQLGEQMNTNKYVVTPRRVDSSFPFFLRPVRRIFPRQLGNASRLGIDAPRSCRFRTDFAYLHNRRSGEDARKGEFVHTPRPCCLLFLQNVSTEFLFFRSIEPVSKANALPVSDACGKFRLTQFPREMGDFLCSPWQNSLGKNQRNFTCY